MVLTIKLSSFAYNVWDGRKWSEIEKDTGDKRKDRCVRVPLVCHLLVFSMYLFFCFSMHLFCGAPRVYPLCVMS